MKRAVTHDLFGIANVLRGIDKDYFVVFDCETQKFEVHNKRQKNTRCFVVPYDELDWRTVVLTRKTRAENARALFDEIERNNARVEMENAQKVEDECRRRVEELL